MYIEKLCRDLQEKIKYGFVTYQESYKWFVIYVKFPRRTEVFIATKQCCENIELTNKRSKEILDYLKTKKLI